MEIEWTDPALADLVHIRSFVARDDPDAASRLAVRLIAAADSLEHFAARGRTGSVAGTRELVVRPYVIVYRIKGKVVQIVRVWHGAQNRS